MILPYTHLVVTGIHESLDDLHSTADLWSVADFSIYRITVRLREVPVLNLVADGIAGRVVHPGDHHYSVVGRSHDCDILRWDGS